MVKKVSFVSLGCAKNLVDSEIMLGLFVNNGYKVVIDHGEADVIVINTCAFINDAKTESIESIFTASEVVQETYGSSTQKKRILIVAGCLSQRYAKALIEEIPEISIVIGTGEYHRIIELINEFKKQKKTAKSPIIAVDKPTFIPDEKFPRLNTLSYMSWIKVSEGCDRHCAFCIIPSIRGRMRSRTTESLVKEIKQLVSKGVREINLIAQDLSVYGKDLKNKNDNLKNLLKNLEKIKNLKWIRLLYYYPDDLDEELLLLMRDSKKICKYLDMPIQHFSDSILKSMNRKITGSKIEEKVHRIRELVPGIVLRTSVIVGFPGETNDDYKILKNAVKRLQFDHLGVFKYSDEEGTKSSKLNNKVAQKIIDKRHDEIYEIQKEIAQKKNDKYLGKILDVVVEGHHEETNLLLIGRHACEAPDIDGLVIINDTNDKKIAVGEFVKVQIDEVIEYDLIGHLA